MAASTAQVRDAAEFDMGFSKGLAWDKQVSAGTTVVPEGDDFSRFTTEVPNEVCSFDEYETRGGMAETTAKQLLPVPEEQGEPLAMSVGGRELDSYEMRGGLADKFWTTQVSGFDAYEVRGGMAAKQSQELVVAPGVQTQVPAVSVGGQELDFYETRGGMAEMFCAAREAGDFDAYEVRGGMAAKLAWQLKSALDQRQEVPSVLVGGQELDFFEARGGMAQKLARIAQATEPDAYEVRGGMAAKLGWQLRQAPQQCAATTTVRVGGQELDFYEARGGMAEMFSSQQDDSIDEYEARGGMAAVSSKQLLPAPAVPREPLAVSVGGQELDFYETRGGIVEKFGVAVEAVELDAYEVRGGMAVAMSSHLMKAPEPSPGQTSVYMGGQELDFYEVRGGMAGKFHIEEAPVLDPYEARGGMAASLSSQLPKAPEQCLEVMVLQLGNSELDFYETRGGMAGLFREKACEADAYEVRGGMAEKMWPRLVEGSKPKMDVETLQVGDMELDFYEMRGGMTEYLRRAAEASVPDAYELRGGLAARYAGQLLQAPPQLEPALGADGCMDFYELRGGMAEHLLREAEAMDADEYEARGGLAEQTSPKLPVFRTELGAPHGAADEGDEYEARGGQGAALHELLPSVCSIA